MHETLKLRRYSYRFAEQVLNSSLALKNEVESVLLDPGIEQKKNGDGENHRRKQSKTVHEQI